MQIEAQRLIFKDDLSLLIDWNLIAPIQSNPIPPHRLFCSGGFEGCVRRFSSRSLASEPRQPFQPSRRTDPNPQATDIIDPAYTRVLEKRAADILDALKLDDQARAARVREIVIAQYRGLRKLHDARDAAIQATRDRRDREPAAKSRSIEAERARNDEAASALNDRFLAALSRELSAEQVEKVKDKMTYQKLQVTYNAYLEMLPDLTAAQKQVIFNTLKEARDKAVYAGSAEEKTEVFNKFKGRVNNYLSAQGYDLKLAAKQWAERRKKAK